MNSSHNPAAWDITSQNYNKVERLSFPFAKILVDRANSLSSLDDPKANVFDNGCGTGVMTAALKMGFPDISILSSDASPDMVKVLEDKVRKAGWGKVETQTLDARNLDGIADNQFSHTFSTFMVCLAPEPEKIVKEMYRVTKPGGILALGNWGDPYFSYFNNIWTKACQMLIPDYGSATIMGESWTRAENIRTGLQQTGFKDVDAWEEKVPWRWENVEELSKYFFDGGNPGNVMMFDSFRAQGGEVEQAKPLFKKLVKEEYGEEGDRVGGEVLASLATARK
ncbi:hypothetical protein ACLMJK_002011 [Lecanora helva]